MEIVSRAEKDSLYPVVPTSLEGVITRLLPTHMGKSKWAQG
jgi:hypothetical protein